MALGFKSPSTLEEAEKATKAAFLVSMIFTATVGTLSVMGMLGFGFWNLLSVILLFLLSFGVYRKSRVCAILLAAGFLAYHLFVWFESGQVQGLISLILIPFYIRGIQGAFAHHNLAAYQLKPLRIIVDDEQNFTVKTVVKFGGQTKKPLSVMAAYYLLVNGEQKGPMSKADAQQLIQNGLPLDTLFWCEGMPQWRSIAEFSELAG